MSKESYENQSQEMNEMDSDEIEVIDDGQDGSPGHPGQSSEEINDRQSSVQIIESIQDVDAVGQQELQVEDQEEALMSQQQHAEMRNQQQVFMNTGQSFGDINAGQRSSQREDNRNHNGNMYQQTIQMQHSEQPDFNQQIIMNQDLGSYEDDMEGMNEAEAEELLANWQQQMLGGDNADTIANIEGVQQSGERQSAHSFGTGSFTTNTFNARLAGSNGMEILKYVQSQEFGKYGESIKLVTNINEFMNKLALENQRMEEENAILNKSNEQFQGLTQLNHGKLNQMVNKKHEIAKEVTNLEAIYHRYDGAEGKFAKREKHYKKDLYDLVEYVKWITNETSILRERVRKAEAVISSLRKSGESSVESLLKTLYKLRQQQIKLEGEAELLRMHVKTKESMIKIKENEKGNMKASLENQKQEQELEFSKLRKQLDEQKSLIGNQRKLLNKLQVLNEVTQAGITQSSQELASKIREKQALSLQINDKSREQNKLQLRHNYLSNEIKNCIPSKKNADGQFESSYQADAVTILPGQHREYNVPNSQYVGVNKYKIRSKNSMFSEAKNPVDYTKIKQPTDF